MRDACAADDPWQGYRQKFRVFFREAHAETFSALSYAGYEYAQNFTKVQPLARLIGTVFDQPKLRAVLLGHNKTFIVAQRFEAPMPSE